MMRKSQRILFIRLLIMLLVLANGMTFAGKASASVTLAPSYEVKTALGVSMSTSIGGFHSYEDWIGRDLRYMTVFSHFSLNAFDQQTSDTGPASGLSSGGTHTTVMTISMVPDSLDSPQQVPGANIDNLNRGLNGEWDSFYEDIANRIVERNLQVPWSDGRPKIIIRLGHEHNGLWYPWSSRDAETKYRDLYRRIHDIVEGIAGTDLIWEYNVTQSADRQLYTEAYPGDSYVDVIGVDFYDDKYSNTTNWPVRTSAQRDASWNQILNGAGDGATTGAVGLKWLVQFAQDHNKKFGISEWGLDVTVHPSSYAGGGDNEDFIQSVYNYFSDVAQSGSLLYMNYFERNGLRTDGSIKGYHKLSPGNTSDLITASPGDTTGSTFPVAAALFVDLFGGTVGTDSQAPTAPSNLTSTAKTDTTVSLSWSASTDNVAVTGYNVYQGSTLVGSTQNTSYTATGLAANTAYSFTVKAKDAAGNLSSASNTLSVTTDGSDSQAPTAPTNLVSTGKTESSVSLSWTASTDNVGVTGYSVFNGTNLAGSVTDTSAMITGLTAGTAYSFTVKAEDAAGNLSSASNTLTITTDATDTQAPTAPTNLASTGKTDTSVSLSWTASTDDTGVTSYNIYNSGVFLDSTSDTHMDLTGLSPNTAYTLTVKAEDAFGNESSASNSVNVTTDPSSSVTHTTLHPSADSYVRDGTDLNTNFGTALSLNVKQGASGHSHETYLKFDLSGISGNISEAKLRINGSWNNSTNTNVPINAYSVSNTSWTETGITWSNKPSAGTTVLASATVIDETPQWYELDLTSYIQAEKSAGHNTVSVALKGSQQTESIGIFSSDEDSSDQPELVVTANTDIVSPTAPSNLSSTGKTKTSVSLTWTAATDNTGVTGYRIFQDGAFTGSTTGTSFTADGLSPNTAYAFTVKAVDAAGNESAASNTVNVTTDSDTPATIILSASADAYVHDGSDSDVNFGSSQVLDVKNGAGDGNHRETYVAFDLSSLSGSVNEAKLRLYGSWNNTTNSNVAVNAYSVADTWDESELTWDNKPAAGASVVASTVIIDTTPRWYEWDLTSYIQGQLSAQNDMASVVLTGSQQTGSIALFHSSENPSNKPQLLVTVNTDTQSPTAPSSLSTTGKTTTSVDLTWTAATDNVGVTGYNIYRDAVSAGTSTGTSFTASGLSANTTYAFTVTAVDAAGNESAASNLINVTTNNTTTTVLSAAADAYVHDGTDSGLNFGSSSILDVKSGASSGNNRETYLKFDLSSLSGSINGATLRLYGAWNNGTNSNVDVNAYSVSNTTWTETGITWNNKPAAGTTLLDSATITDTTQRWYEWDLTSYIQAEKSAGHNTVCIVLKGSQQTSSIAVFQADEASSNQPQLVIAQ